MQSTNIPTKIPLPFAYAAGGSYIDTIPSASQIGITDGRASLHDGFPPLTFQAISLGGVPPLGADFNGILNEITAITQWQQAGGMFIYDAAFSSTIGGYPKGAVLQKASLSGMWLSTTENNITNPDTGGAGWISANVQSFNTRTGAVTLTSADVTTALGYTPYNATNPSNYGPPIGSIIQFAGVSAPTGYLACPTTLTNISRITYSALFAAIGTAWGVGDGSTTFGMPYFPSGYGAVAGVVGTTTPGSVIAHTHTYSKAISSGNQKPLSSGTAPFDSYISNSTSSTGGAANFGAGSSILFCVKYL